MSDEETRARRMYSINEALIEHMGQQIKREVGKLIDAGRSVDEINEALVHVVVFWDQWREDTLEKIMQTFDEAEALRPASDVVLVRPRTN